PQPFGPLAIYIQTNFRGAGLKGGKSVDNRRILVSGSRQGHSGIFKGLGTDAAPVLHHHLKTTGITNALYGRWRNHKYVGFLDLVRSLVKRTKQLLVFDVMLIPVGKVFKRQKYYPFIGCIRKRCPRQTRKCNRIFYTVNL